MQAKRVRLGFVGFGEAGYYLGKGLFEAGLTGVVAYSRSGAKATPDDPLHARAAEAGVELVSRPYQLCERADVIIALTPGRAALAALRAIRPYLHADHIYVDASTASVKAMERAGNMLEGKAGFVDAAIMGTVPLNGIKVQIMASGACAQRFMELLTPYGMNIQVVGAVPGAASAMKLIRSVFMKGLATLLLESLEAAQRSGVLETVAADIAASMDERPFEQIIKRFVCGTAVHAERRVNEMTHALELLRALGSSTTMTRATRAMISDIAKMGLREHFGGQEPESIAPVIESMISRRRPSGP